MVDYGVGRLSPRGARQRTPIMNRSLCFRLLLTLFIVELGFCCFNTSASAGLNFCNSTNQKVYVAVAWLEASDWRGRGWFAIDPGDCTEAVQGDLRNRHYWYFAKSADDHLIWSGEGDRTPGSDSFCISSDRFYYGGAKRTSCEQ